MSFVAIIFCRLTFDVKRFHTKVTLNWEDLVTICEKYHVNSEGTERGAEGYEPFPENKAKILENQVLLMSIIGDLMGSL